MPVVKRNLSLTACVFFFILDFLDVFMLGTIYFSTTRCFGFGFGIGFVDYLVFGLIITLLGTYFINN